MMEAVLRVQRLHRSVEEFQFLNVCIVIRAIPFNRSLNALTSDDADLFFSGKHHACFEKTSNMVESIRRVLAS